MVIRDIFAILILLLHLAFGQKDQVVWNQPTNFDKYFSRYDVYEDDNFNTTALISITWNDIAKKCSVFEVVPHKDFSALSKLIRNVYVPKSEKALVFLDDLFMNTLEDKYSTNPKGQLVKMEGILSNCEKDVDERSQQEFGIFVKAINRNEPTIIRKSREKIRIRENEDMKGILETLTAKDLDMNRGNEMSTLTIELDNSNDQTVTENFRLETTLIGKTEGYEVKVFLEKALDYENQNAYMLDIKVTDKSENRTNATKPNVAISSLFIDVVDIHDQAPRFMKGCGAMTVDEETAVDTEIVTVRAIDSDTGVKPQGKIEYSLIGNQIVSKYFKIGKETGVLSVNTPPNLKDPELRNQLMLTFEIMALELNGATFKPEKTDNNVTTTCILTIRDIDNSPPTFKLKQYEATIPEHSFRETPVNVMELNELSIKDEDMDKNAEYKIDLEWKLDIHDDMFQVIPKQGVGETIFSVRVKNNTNLEYDDDRLGSEKKVILTLIATGTLNKSMTDRATFTIQVTDENDNPPRITSELNAKIMENSKPGTELTKIEANDRDSGLYGKDGIVFSIPTSSSLTESFEIDKKSGIIKLKPGNKVDREVQELLYLPIEVMDNLGNTPTNRVTGQIEITVLDDNDNAPIFQVEKFSTILNENEDEFQGSIKLEAKDNDKPGTDNSKVEYHLTKYENFFEVDKDNGDFKLKKKLDFEAKELTYPEIDINTKSKIASRVFNMEVYANDCGKPTRYSEINATILVQFMDTNDNVPKFVNQSYQSKIEEVLQPRKSINVSVKAIDADISPAYSNVYYSLSQDSGSNFLINRTSGEITVAPGANLAPEENKGQKVFQLTVHATDGLSDNDDDDSQPCTVTVEVIDVNNQRPIFNDVDQKILLTSFEEENLNAVQLAIFLAKDVDETHDLKYRINFDESRAETPQFSIVGPGYNWKDVFKIDQKSGVLTAKKADREEMKKVLLVIEAEDVEADERYSPQIVKIQREFIVLDINDHAPEFVNNNGKDHGPEGILPSYMEEVIEHEERANLFKIEATDKDENNTITFELLPYKGNDITYFKINKTNGVVSMKGVDYDEGLHWMNVTIKATDNGVPTQSSLAYITVQIIDKNDNSPVFNASINHTIWMKENEPLNTLIITLHATDKDEKDEYGLVHYRFHRDEKDSHMFNIHAETGEMRNQVILDYEERTEFKVSVEAFDNPRDSKNSNSEQKYVVLNLIDVNDNAPIFDAIDCLRCKEDYIEGRIVGTITATDRDSPGPNSQIEFIMEEDDHGFFKIDLKGEITVNKNLTNYPGVYNITITARDKGVDPGPLNTTRVFCIEIEDINNNRPQFIGGNRVLLREEAPVEDTLKGKLLTTVEAEDIDLDENGRVTYYFISITDKSNGMDKANAFTINQNTGQIYFNEDLKKKDVAIYIIVVNAKDNGIPALIADSIDLEVEIISKEDHLPQFNMDDATYPLNFTENEPPGAEYQIIPEAKYREIKANEKPKSDICYVLIGGDTKNFVLDMKTRYLTVTESLDREKHAYHHIIVRAKACDIITDSSVKLDDEAKPDVINITIRVIDVNDNPPQFIMKPFTSGVSSSTIEDRKILTVKAIDPDEGPNAVVHYKIYGNIQTDGTENVNINSKDPPFIIGELTGDITSTFTIAKNMKGHFNFTVMASDIDNLNDTVQVLIYFFRDDQQIILIVDKPPNQITDDVKFQLTGVLTDITKHYCSVVAVKQYEADTPSILQKNHSNIYVLFVNNETQRVLEPGPARTMINMYSKDIAASMADTLRLVDVIAAGDGEGESQGLTAEQLTHILIGISSALILALLVAMTLSCLKINSLKRNLRAANATAFGSQESGLNRVGVKSAPNTNQHTVEGSNPVWNHKDEIVYNENRSIYGSETASIKSEEVEDLNEIIEYPNESKVNPAFLNEEYLLPEENAIPQSKETNEDNEKKNKMFKKNTVNTLRQIDKDWRRRNTEGELNVPAIKKNSMMDIFDLPDRRRLSTFIPPVPTSEL